MSNYIQVIAIVEGKTEQIFIENIIAPYLGHKQIGISATQVSKPGQKGGDVRFERVKKDLGIHLKQRPDTYVTTFVDYYGIKEWPANKKFSKITTGIAIAKKIEIKTMREMCPLFNGWLRSFEAIQDRKKSQKDTHN